jgi:hypothetical protein
VLSACASFANGRIGSAIVAVWVATRCRPPSTRPATISSRCGSGAAIRSEWGPGHCVGSNGRNSALRDAHQVGQMHRRGLLHAQRISRAASRGHPRRFRRVDETEVKGAGRWHPRELDDRRATDSEIGRSGPCGIADGPFQARVALFGVALRSSVDKRSRIKTGMKPWSAPLEFRSRCCAESQS